jgi:hypothetical protein
LVAAKTVTTTPRVVAGTPVPVLPWPPLWSSVAAGALLAVSTWFMPGMSLWPAVVEPDAGVGWVLCSCVLDVVACSWAGAVLPAALTPAAR